MTDNTPTVSGGFDKSLLTNLIAAIIVAASFFVPAAQAQLFSVGVFALSGALTNWLAIHMLFERVPLLYGSGVIPNRFQEFKAAIRELIMQQFFNSEAVQRFINEEENAVHQWIRPGKMVESIDYDTLFERLVDAIMESSFGGMLKMFGGRDALTSLKESFIDKIKITLVEMVERDSFKAALARGIDSEKLGDDMQEKIGAMVDQRLEELTPEMVKDMVQQLIKQHLGWLVVWGGVFGGLIGLAVSFIP